jgi:TrpR-related protein YerC/YecD
MKIHRVHPGKESEDPEHKLFEAIAAIKTPEEARKFFKDLCTPAEIQAMADRWRVVDSIKKEKPYRKIYDETGVSVTTVGRVARCIILGEGGYNLIYERLEKKSHESNSKTKNSNTKKRASKQ